MKAIVFGGSGFLGSYVADALTKSDYDVTIFDIKESPYLLDNQKMIVGDILDAKAVEIAVKGADYVYNFAGIASLDDCVHRPVDTVKCNIMGNTVVLDASVKAKIKRFIFASTVYVYSEAGDFYRCSKQASELYIETYHKLYRLPYTILRYGSLYGNRTDERNSIYRIIKEAMTTGRIIYYGNGEETREYIHVEDAAKLSVEILTPEYENSYLILTGYRVMKYKYLLDMIKEMMGNNVEIIYKASKSDAHYQITPYSFNPRMGRKLVSNSQIDMGQGLLNCMAEIHSRIYREKYEELEPLINNNRELIHIGSI